MGGIKGYSWLGAKIISKGIFEVKEITKKILNIKCFKETRTFMKITQT